MLDRPTLADDDARWAAVLARDPEADGTFVLAVRTTGIYCRPTCPARRPKRENTAFYADGAEARAAGFRPCRRCEPDAGRGERIAERAVAAAARLIQEAVASEEPIPDLETLAARAGYAPHHLHRLFKRATGLTPRAFARALRARRAEAELSEGASVTEAITAAGYGSPSRFYEAAGARLGMAPSVRRAGGRGETIRHAAADTSLGRVRVAATERGICAITFGKDDAEHVAWLSRRFPAAEIVPADAGFAATLRAVVAMIERPGTDAGLPLDLRGTAFQERVWAALRAIQPGTTASYAAIAEAIGQPTAARAVATACAANPTAVAVPCHRVLRADGSLSGYRWGVGRKAALLKRERGD